MVCLRQTGKAIPFFFQLCRGRHAWCDRFPCCNAAIRIMTRKSMVGTCSVLHQSHLQRDPFLNHFRRKGRRFVALAWIMMIEDVFELMAGADRKYEGNCCKVNGPFLPVHFG